MAKINNDGKVTRVKTIGLYLRRDKDGRILDQYGRVLEEYTNSKGERDLRPVGVGY